MEERRGKRETQAVSITTDLILRLAQQTKLAKVTELSIRLPNDKIRRIEGLAECLNLRTLDLSYNFISKLENLEALTQLRELNLSENNIRRLEGLRTLHALETLNLAGNQLRQLPKAELEPLSALKTLKVMRNKLESPEELKGLTCLPSLTNLGIEGNPVCSLADLELFLVFHVPGLQQLEGATIATATRQKAMRRFEKAKADVYVVRENLVSFRKQVSDLQEERQDLLDQQSLLSHQLQSIDADLEDAKAQTFHTAEELRSIQEMLTSSSMDQLRLKKAKMKELLTRAENLRNNSQELQNSMRRFREQITRKEAALTQAKKRRRNESSGELDETTGEREATLTRELKADRGELQQCEEDYDAVVAKLQQTMQELDALEQDISQRKVEPTPRWNEDKDRYRTVSEDEEESRYRRSQERLERTFDQDTAQYLPRRREEIADLLPKLQSRVEELEARRQGLLGQKGTVDSSLRHTDEALSSLKEKIRGNEQFIEKKQSSVPPSPSHSPLRPKSRTELALDALKTLWRQVTGGELEETEDLQGAILKVCKAVPEAVDRKLQEKEIEFSTQVRIDQANISILNSKVTELAQENEQLRLAEMSKESDSSRYQAVERELRQTQGKVVDLEREKGKLQLQVEHLDLLVKKRTEEELLYKDLETDREALQQQVADLIDEKERLTKALKAAESTAKSQSLRSDSAILREVEDLRREKQEMTSALAAAHVDLKSAERELLRAREDMESEAEDKAKALYAVKKLAGLFNLSPSTDLPTLIDSIETSVLDLQDDLSKAERFRLNKEKFVSMYENNTAQLQAEWEKVAAVKQDLHTALDLEAENVTRLKEERMELEREVSQLEEDDKDLRSSVASSREELERLEREVLGAKDALSALKAQSSSLSETIDRLSALKSQANDELERLKRSLDTENAQYHSTSDELRSMKKEVLELRNEKIEKESWLQFARSQQEKAEARRTALDEEVKTYEEMLRSVAERLATEEKTAQQEVNAVKFILTEKKELVQRVKEELEALEEQLADKQRQHTILAREQEEECEALVDLKSSKKQLASEVRSLEVTLQSLQEQARAVQSQIDRHNKQTGDKETALNRLDNEVEARRAEASAARTEAAAAGREANLERARLAAILEEVKQAEAALAESRAKFYETQQNAEDQREMLTRITQQISEKEGFLASLHKEQSSLSGDIDLLQARMTQLTQERETHLAEQAQSRLNLQAVQQEKKAAYSEIQRLYADFEEAEKRHRSEVAALERGVQHGEKTLRQLQEAVSREKGSLQQLHSDSRRFQAETEDYCRRMEAAKQAWEREESKLQEAEQKLIKLKQEEDTALVLLAVSGHKVDQKVMERVAQLCRAEQELAALRSPVERPTRDLPVRLDSAREPDTARPPLSEEPVSSASSVDIARLQPQVSEMQRLLEHLEEEHRRIRTLIQD